MQIIYHLMWLFLIYSFTGWILETIVAAAKQKRFVNRGVINGPFCIIYGIAAVILTVVGRELRGIWLFIGCVIVTALIEFVAGHLVEKLYHEKWWNYSNLPMNLDGYISVPTSLFWGLLGFLIMQFGNNFLLKIYSMIPSLAINIVIIILMGIIILDGTASTILLIGRGKRMERWKATDEWLDSVSNKLGGKIYTLIDARINHAYPEIQSKPKEEINTAVFASGCGFYKVVMLFFIGAFLGDVIETIFCRITMGEWMSRSSVVWGPFSIVWGLAIAFVTAFFYKYRNSSVVFLFFLGTFLGGAYEYVCSVFTEIVFGKVFWDYSNIPYNLGGRINLLYCFFWGFAAVIWFRGVYRVVSGLIERIPKKIGKIFTWVFLIFMICNVAVSSMALVRYDARGNGKIAENQMEKYLDQNFPDERMQKIYPNALNR